MVDSLATRKNLKELYILGNKFAVICCSCQGLHHILSQLLGYKNKTEVPEEEVTYSWS